MSEFFKRAPAFRAGCLARPALQSAFICILVFAISMTMAAINPVYASGTVASQPPLPLYTGGVWTYHAISAFGGGRWIEPPQPTPEQACGLVTAQAVNLGYSSPYSESTTRSVSLWVGPYSYQTIIIPWAYCFASYGGVSYGLGNMEANAGCPDGYQGNGGATSFATDYCIRLSDANRCPANSTGTPAANPTTCTCIDPNVPDATKTSCVTPATNCPPHASGSPCACDPGYSPYAYFNQMGCYLPAACPANMSGSPCACNAGYVPNPAGAGCISANACPPNMSGSPCSCNSGYAPNPSGAGCIVDYFIIGEFQDQLTDIEPGASSEIKVRVVSALTGLPRQGAVVKVHLDVETSSGGHDHGESGWRRSRGSISGCKPEPNGGGATPDSYHCTTGTDGYAGSFFKAPDASGKYTITATCLTVCIGSKTAQINVKVPGLAPIPDSPYYSLTEPIGGGKTKIVGATDNHKKNHFLTVGAAAILEKLAKGYHTAFPLAPVLYINDASLEWGGKFDIAGNWGGEHAEHTRGTVVDVRANPAGYGTMPLENFNKFKDRQAKLMRVDAQIHCTKDKKGTPPSQKHNRTAADNCVSKLDGSQDNNRHFHVRLMGVSE